MTQPVDDSSYILLRADHVHQVATFETHFGSGEAELASVPDATEDHMGGGLPLTVLREAGRACNELGLFSDGQSYLEQAVAGFSARQDLNGEAIALGRLAWVLRDQGRNDQVRSLLVRAVELLEQQDPGAELAVAYGDLASYEWLAGSLSDALAWANKALGVARSCGGSEVLADGLHVRGLLRCDSGDTGGLEDLQESLKLDEEAGDPRRISADYQNLADVVWLIEGPGQGLERSDVTLCCHRYRHLRPANPKDRSWASLLGLGSYL